jgi:hypothetical protein
MPPDISTINGGQNLRDDRGEKRAQFTYQIGVQTTCLMDQRFAVAIMTDAIPLPFGFPSAIVEIAGALKAGGVIVDRPGNK